MFDLNLLPDTNDHAVALIVTSVIGLGLMAYAVCCAFTVYETWSVIGMLSGCVSAVMLICLIPITVRLVKCRHIASQIRKFRCQNNRDDAGAGLAIIMSSRIAQCQSQKRHALIGAATLCVLCAAGTAVAYVKSDEAIASLMAQAEISKQQTEEQAQQNAKFLETREHDARLKIETRRTQLQTEIDNQVLELLNRPVDSNDELTTQIKTCKRHPDKCFRDSSSGWRIKSQYDVKLTKYTNHLKNFIVYQLDDIFGQDMGSHFAQKPLIIHEIQNEWHLKLDKHFYELYQSGLFQDAFKASPIGKHLASARIKNNHLHTLIAQLLYLDALGKVILDKTPPHDTTEGPKYTSTDIMPSESAFQAEFEKQYEMLKPEDSEKPGYVLL